MDPITGLAIGSGISNIFGGIVGNILGADDRERAQQAMADALRAIQEVGAPPELAKQIVIDKLSSVGVYTPQLEEAVNQEVSQLANIQEDPALRNTQRDALDLIVQRANTGLTAEDRAAYNELRRQTEQQARQKEEAILQGMQQRGMLSSGATLAAQLSGSQAADQAAAAGGDRIAAQASKAALEALSLGSNVASNLRNQDFNVNSTKAKAADEMNRFNIQNTISRNARNVDTSNQAALRNLTEAQRIKDANVNAGNQERLLRVQQQGSDYDRKLGYAGAKANALTGNAQQAQAQGDRTANQYAQIGSGVGGLLGAVGSKLQSDKDAASLKAKEDADRNAKYGY